MHALAQPVSVPANSYRVAILRTDDSDEAREHNAQWLGEKTLGIEVTIDALASQCVLGHIDPQHRADGTSSAIEAALEWPLPPHDSRLVTIRQDRDSIGAMAVLLLRAEQRDKKIDKLLVNALGVLDRMPIDRAQAEYGDLLAMFSRDQFDAMSYIVKQSDWPLMRKVKMVANMLVDEMPKHEMARYARLRAEAQARLRESSCFTVNMYCSVAFCEAPGEYEYARTVVNQRHPIAVIHDPERITDSGGKQDRWCVVRQVRPKKVFDRASFVAAVNAAEANARDLSLDELTRQGLIWGGPPNLVISPQGEGRGTKLPREEILELVRVHYDSGVVS